MAVDADDPAMLVAALENSGQGCEWLLGQWRALGERLEGQNFWQSIDRYRAVRLLGAMPTDAGFDRVICEIYVASHGIEPPRKKRPDEDPCQDRAANRPFADLKSDFPQDELTHFVEGMKARWPDMVSTKDRDGCREILVNLVEENIQRLTALLEVHEGFTQQDAQRTVTRLGFDRSRDVELMRRWELRYRVALERSIVTYDKVHGKDQAEKEDDRVRRTELRSPIPPYGSQRRRGGGEAGRNMAPDATGECTADDDTQWAREIDTGGVSPCRGDAAFAERKAAMVIDTADVLACGGYLPERCLDGLTVDGEPAAGEGEVAGDQSLDALVPAAGGDGLAGSTQPLAGSTQSGGHLVGDDFFKESVGPLEDDAMVTGQPAINEANAWRPSVDEGAGSGDPRPAFDGSRIDHRLDNNVTNEPSFAEKESGLQLHGEIGVTADFEKGSALDKLENEPTCEGAATAVGVADSDEASMGGRSPMQHDVRAPAAAISRHQKKKSERQQHLERKTLQQGITPDPGGGGGGGGGGGARARARARGSARAQAARADAPPGRPVGLWRRRAS